MRTTRSRATRPSTTAVTLGGLTVSRSASHDDAAGPPASSASTRYCGTERSTGARPCSRCLARRAIARPAPRAARAALSSVGLHARAGAGCAAALRGAHISITIWLGYRTPWHGQHPFRPRSRPERPEIGRHPDCYDALPQVNEPPSSSGPGRRPFKAVTGIRTPLGAHAHARVKARVHEPGPVVQFGVHAALSRRRSRVQISSGPLGTHVPTRPGSSVGRARAEKRGSLGFDNMRFFGFDAFMGLPQFKASIRRHSNTPMEQCSSSEGDYACVYDQVVENLDSGRLGAHTPDPGLVRRLAGNGCKLVAADAPSRRDPCRLRLVRVNSSGTSVLERASRPAHVMSTTERTSQTTWVSGAHFGFLAARAGAEPVDGGTEGIQARFAGTAPSASSIGVARPPGRGTLIPRPSRALPNFGERARSAVYLAPGEQGLYRTLLDGYEPSERPVKAEVAGSNPVRTAGAPVPNPAG